MSSQVNFRLKPWTDSDRFRKTDSLYSYLFPWLNQLDEANCTAADALLWSQVCSSCSSRNSCGRGYILTRKEDEACTFDIMRILLTFSFDHVEETVENKPLMKMKFVKNVVRKLLHEIVLSAIPIDPSFPPPVIKKPPPKVSNPLHKHKKEWANMMLKWRKEIGFVSSMSFTFCFLLNSTHVVCRLKLIILNSGVTSWIFQKILFVCNVMLNGPSGNSLPPWRMGMPSVSTFYLWPFT